MEVISPWLTTFCPGVDFKIEALGLIQFEILEQITSLFLAFTSWQQQLHLEMLIEAVLNAETQNVLRPLSKGLKQ